ncbi:MAG: bifunctional acetate--CoA ligase family protein/GNAT family N-acetyltransferase [Syntrophobacteraceae bacterium]
MPIKNLPFLFAPQSVALIAPCRELAPVSAACAQNLLGAGWKRKLFAVGAKKDSFEGFPCYRDVQSLPEAPDLAVLVAAKESMPAQIDRLGRLGAKTLVLINPDGAGPAEEQSERLHSAIREAVKAYAMRIVGPGSIGVLTPSAALNVSIASEQPLRGNLALVSQSGTVLETVLGWANSRGIGFSHLIDLGEMIDVDFGDMLDYLANDFDTRAILLYMETVTHIRKFMPAARLASHMKPVVVLKGGRRPDSGISSILHGGQTNGVDAIYHAAFRRAGMIRAADVRELFSAAESLGGAKALPGRRVAVLTNGRGIGTLAVDSVLDRGGVLSQLSSSSLKRLNDLLPALTYASPLDVSHYASAQIYTDVLRILFEDEGIDAVLLLHCSNALQSCAEVARELLETLIKNNMKSKFNRLLTSWTGDGSSADARRLFKENSIGAYDTPLEAVSGFIQMVRYRRNQELLMQTPPSVPDDFLVDSVQTGRIVERAAGEGRDRLSEPEMRAVLRAYGIADRKPVESKTACRLIAGVFNDAQFGRVIFFGYGGEEVEAIADLAFALPPLNRHLAREVMTRTRIYGRLEGATGAPTANLDGIEHVLVKLSQLVCDIPQIVELRLDPLLVDSQGISVIDGFVRIAQVDDVGRPHLIIAPYPKELEETIRLPDGRTLLLRPIRPEDEPAYVRLFESLPPEDIMRRFLHAMKTFPHSLAASLTQLDYDREMALVLIGENEVADTPLLGVVGFTADADNDRAEFAILLHRTMTGMGLGPMMMRKIIQAARRRGIKELYGDVLSENFPMLKICRALGFSLKRMPDDAGVVTASLVL